MKALVIHHSFFGNTEKIAKAIGAALAETGEVEVLAVGEMSPELLEGLDVLVVGSPTRAFSPVPEIKGWLKKLPKDALNGVDVAAFDTRVELEDVGSRPLRFIIKLFGYAAEPMASLLAKAGGSHRVEPAGFGVMGTEGPLKEGAEERAKEWARSIAEARRSMRP